MKGGLLVNIDKQGLVCGVDIKFITYSGETFSFCCRKEGESK